MKQKILILFTVLYFSCGKEEKCVPEEINTYYPIPEKYKGEIPYKDGDSVVFLGQNNDTLIYKIKNTVNRFVKTSELLGGIDCPGSQNTHTENLVFDFVPYYYNDPKINFKAEGRLVYPTFDSCVVNIYIKDGWNVKSFDFLTSKKTPQDSISLNGITYFGRFLSGVNYVLYNTQIGISRFDFEGSQYSKIY